MIFSICVMCLKNKVGKLDFLSFRVVQVIVC